MYPVPTTNRRSPQDAAVIAMMTGNAKGSTKRMDSTATAKRVKLIPAKSVRKEIVRRGREVCKEKSEVRSFGVQERAEAERDCILEPSESALSKHPRETKHGKAF